MSRNPSFAYKTRKSGAPGSLKIKGNVRIKFKGSGQECPLYTGLGKFLDT
jgi:hypothetical protein